jgi:hypothetical protein
MAHVGHTIRPRSIAHHAGKDSAAPSTQRPISAVNTPACIEAPFISASITLKVAMPQAAARTGTRWLAGFMPRP